MSLQLAAIAEELVAPGKGILAADESTPTIQKRFDAIQVTSTYENRRDYREMLFRAPGIENCISGVIMYDETLRQEAADGTPLPKLLASQGILAGIKVDAGAKPLAGYPGETVTEGLDGLRGRLKEYHALGARFAKWRAVITIGTGLPSQFCLEANAHALARYAALCQEAGLVPIVEPEVLMDADNTLEVCRRVTEEILDITFVELAAHRVAFDGMILKPNMVISGKKCSVQAPPEQVAEATVATLNRCVPDEVPGIAFLSGGQSEQQATQHLSLINRLGPHPWALTFSYGRALQQAALTTWAGRADRVNAAQDAFAHRFRCCGAAATGEYTPAMES
jgi:fructose-bisphosphate aldolase class I